MFIQPPSRNEKLLKYALVGIGVALVITMLSALFFFKIGDDGQKRQATEEKASLTSEQELKLQEQIAPLIKGGDMKACDSVQNDMYKKVCINNIALNKAEETKDIAYCQYLDNELIERSSCERQIMNQKAIEKEDKSVCSETKDEKLKQECEDSFLFGMANKKQDPKLCDQDTDKTKADQCWNGYYAQKMMIPTDDGKRSSPDCGLFRGEDTKADCQALASAMKGNDQQKLMESCQSQKTRTFFQVCMMMNQGGMTPPVMGPKQ